MFINPSINRTPQAPIVDYLVNKPGVRLIGTRVNALRVPTIGFTHDKKSPTEIVAALHAAKIACRSGHMYARRLMDAIYPDSADAHKREADWGVVRVSLAHYNTAEEVERFIAALDAFL